MRSPRRRVYHRRAARSPQFSLRARVVISIITFLMICASGWYARRIVCGMQAAYKAVYTELSHTQTQLRSVLTQQKVTQAVALQENKNSGWPAVQRKIEDGVVQVFTQMASFDWLRPYRAPEEVTAVGSGFFINEQGDILTNYHVVSQARSIKIRLPRLGQEQFAAEIVGVCPDRDIALLRLSEAVRARIVQRLGRISPLILGESDQVIRTQEVMALGFPHGRLSLKSTIGNVSGWERMGNQSFIQLTSPLNPGNSGGPAVNREGVVVGVNAAGIQEAQNTGFFIPITEIKHVLRNLYDTKLLRKPILGGDFAMYMEPVREYLGNPEGGGWYVTHVYDGTLLAKAGVKKGDVLYEINGYQLDQYGDVEVSWATDSKVSALDLLNRYGVGDTLSLVVYRRGQRKECILNLDNKFILPVRKVYPDFEAVDYEICGGMVLMHLNLNIIQLLLTKNSALTPSLARYLRPDKQYDNALVVTHVFPGSPAQEAKLIDVGLIIDTINGQSIRTLTDARRAILMGQKRKFMTLTAQYDRRFTVLSYDEIRKNEGRIAALHGYKMTKLMKAVVE